ncbi:hypothetical protein M436DRAFT_79006 [Aureobasidium namibiae CBS 147.97]|uniref:Uncharacterized protein n=1 Tax=Aureobasidium namibiae CBS 147.97 TaxID=1043004 RepID=A0A074WVS0_9PEZI
MADNTGQQSIWWTIFSRSTLVIVATCITICTATISVPVLFVMFVLVAISPEYFSNMSFGIDTNHIRLDLKITSGQMRAGVASPHPTISPPTTPQDNRSSSTRSTTLQSPSRQSPSPRSPSGPAAYTWVRQYHSQQPTPLNTAFAAQQPYTWRAASGHLPSNANIQNSLPPYLPPISEPEPIPMAQLPSRYGAYTSMDTTPPTRSAPTTSPPLRRRRRRPSSNFSWDADDRLPPARPDEVITPSRPGALRRTTAESMPGLVHIVDDDSGDEALPVYDRPPEYDDEAHSQPPLR